MIRIHQVLATLGYGDAIGHEVLGIQRVLRAAGYESEIFVETADHRLEPLTRDYRELVDASHPDNLLLHHFSLGSKASRTAFALPDRMALIYHNITPPEYFVGVHRTLARQCFRGRRELRAYADRCDLALGDSEFNRQDLEALGFPAHRRAAGRAGLLAPRRRAEPARRRPVRRRLDEHPVRRPRDREQEDRGPDPLLPRLPHDVQPALAAADRRRAQRVRAVPGVAAPAGRRARRCRTCTSSATCPTRSSSRSTRSPICSCARASTRASACRSSRRSTSRCRCSPTPRRPCRRRWTAPACCSTTRIRSHVAALMDAIVSNADAAGRDRRRPARGRRSAAGEGLRRHAARVRRTDPGGAARARAPRSPSTSGISSTPRRSSRSCGCTGRRIYKALPEAPMIVNQWVPAAHRGDAIGDSARRVRDLLRGDGPRVRAVRADDRRRPDGRRAAVHRSGGATRRPDDLPLRAAVADDRRRSRRSPRGRILQYHNVTPAAFFAPYDPALFRLAVARPRASWRRSSGRVDLALGDSEYNRQELEALGFAPTGVFPIAVDTVARHPAVPAAGARADPGRRARELPVRRPDRAEQEDRGSHPAGRALQALRRRLLPLHLRRPVRRRAAVLFDDSRADGRVPAAARSLHLHRPGARRGARRLLPARGRLHLAQRARRASACRSSRRWPPTCRCSRTRPPPCPTRSAAPACSSRRRISSTPPSCSARWRSTTTCGRRSSPASAGGSPTSATRASRASSPSLIHQAVVKLAFIIQRYGAEVLGGSEHLCRLRRRAPRRRSTTSRC